MIEGDPRFDRQALGRALQEAPAAEPPAPPRRRRRRLPVIDWSSTGHPNLAPKVEETPRPKNYDPLPPADVVVMTWTAAEWEALDYVFSDQRSREENPRPGPWRDKWHPWRRDFYTVYPDLWSRRLISAFQRTAVGTPALNRSAQRWGSYMLVRIGSKRVLLFKSDLHLNQDGERLPVASMVRRCVLETGASLVLSAGTAGGVEEAQVLGDAMVTNAARFRLDQEFGNAAFNTVTHASSYAPPDTMVEAASRLLMRVPEFEMVGPTAHFPEGTRLAPDDRQPTIKIDPRPILTTDFFEFGTTHNRLGEEGCTCEMGDAVIGREIDRLNEERDGPDVGYAFVRNVSDPVINGDLPLALQTAWAVVTYQLQGLETSYNGAIATWALIAADAEEAG